MGNVFMNGIKSLSRSCHFLFSLHVGAFYMTLVLQTAQPCWERIIFRKYRPPVLPSGEIPLLFINIPLLVEQESLPNKQVRKTHVPVAGDEGEKGEKRMCFLFQPSLRVARTA